jgi:hypothetical protein
MRFAHFNLSDGRIVQVNAGTVFDRRGYGVLLLDQDSNIKAGVVDLSSLLPTSDGLFTGSVIAEIELATIAVVKQLRDSELAGTDWYVSLPADRPGAEDMRARWTPYRQALRDLGQFAIVNDMLAAWPLRPDGLDAVAHLREGLMKVIS